MMMSSKKGGFFDYVNFGTKKEKEIAEGYLYFGILEQHLIEKHRTYIAEDIHEKASLFHEYPRKYFKSIMIVPIYSNDGCLGVLYVGNSKITKYDKSQIESAENIAKLIALPLETIILKKENESLIQFSTKLNKIYNKKELYNYIETIFNTFFPLGRNIIVDSSTSHTTSKALSRSLKNTSRELYNTFSKEFTDKEYYLWSDKTRVNGNIEKLLSIFELKKITRYFRNILIFPIQTNSKFYGHIFIFEKRTKIFTHHYASLFIPIINQITAIMERIEQEKLNKDNIENNLKIAISHAAHKIGNPLNIIENDINLAKKSKETIDNDFLISLEEEVKYIKDFLSNFRKFSMTRSYNKSKVLIIDILKKSFLEKQLNEKNIIFNKNINISDDLVVYCDEKKLIYIFNELFTNAISNNKKNGYINLYIKYLKNDNILNITLQNSTKNNTGIKDEEKKKIFAPFFTTRDQGMGMGLSDVKQILEDHNGTIKEVGNEKKDVNFNINIYLG